MNKNFVFTFGFLAVLLVACISADEGCTKKINELEKQLAELNIERDNSKVEANVCQKQLSSITESHRSSIQVCTETSNQQSSAIETCQKKLNDSVTKLNDISNKNFESEKTILSLKAQLSNSEANSNNNSAFKRKIDDLESQNKKLTTELKNLKNQLSLSKNDFEKKEKIIQQCEKDKIQIEKSINNMKKTSESSNRYVFSTDFFLNTMYDVKTIYVFLGHYMFSLLPENVNKSVNDTSLKVKNMFASYLNDLEVYTSKLCTSSSSHLKFAADIYKSTFKAPVEKTASYIYHGGLKLGAIIMPKLENCNEKIEKKLENFIAENPTMVGKIPPSLVDKFFMLFCLILLLVLAFKIVYFFLNYCSCSKKTPKGYIKMLDPFQARFLKKLEILHKNNMNDLEIDHEIDNIIKKNVQVYETKVHNRKPITYKN